MAAKKPITRDPVTSVWAGNPKFACPFCAFDSLEEARVREHIEQLHPVPAPPEKAATTDPVTVVTDKEHADG